MLKKIKKVLGLVNKEEVRLIGFSNGYKKELQQDLGIYIELDNSNEKEYKNIIAWSEGY